jgi:P4 family phage/plasmid primase-like protien
VATLYDLTLIKSRINCVDVAKRCGLPILKSGDRCVSPLRPGAKNPSSFSVEDDFWYDFGAGAGGDCIDLLAELSYSGDRGAAIRELARITGVAPEGVDNTAEWLDYTNQLNAQTAFYHSQLTSDDRDYLHSRGLTDEDIDRLMIGRVTDGFLRGRLFLPYFSGSDGYVTYYATRALPGSAHPDSKYMKQKRDEHCRHVPWGLQTLNRSADTLIIAEGYFDAAAFECQGYPVISAITGNFSRDQIPTVLSVCRKFNRVFLVYDNDPDTHAGAKFTERMSQLLTRNRIPFIVGTVPIPFHDISEYYAAGGDLQRIIDSAQDGVQYIASTYRNFDDLERYVYTVARHTKRSRLDALQQHLIRTSDFDRRLIDNLFRAATTAPPETIITDEILSEHNLVYVPSVGFYEYLSGVWQRQPDDIIRGYADRAYGEFSTANRVNAICNLLRVRAIQDVSFDRAPVWNFINGTLDLETGVFRDHNPSDYCSVQASYPYNPTATAPAWEQFISDVTGDDPKTEELLQFIPGYALFHNCPHEKIFALTGSGGNGKSVYLAVLRQLFGEDNVSYLQPRALLKDFQRIKLRSSIINIAGEIKSNLTEVEELLKSIASGEPQTACYKGKDYVDFIPRTKLLFACNGQLQSGDTSDGLTRRLVLIDFKMRFVDNPNPGDSYERRKDIHILDKLSAEVQSGAVFNWVYAGYNMLRTVGYFTETADQLVLLEDFKRASNPILLFFEDMERKPEYDNSEIYRDYRQWCDDNGHRPMASNTFHREFKRVAEQDYESFRTNKNRGYRLK